MRGEIIYPFPNFNSTAVEFGNGQVISSHTLLGMYVIAYPWFELFCISKIGPRTSCSHDDVIKWKHFPRYWPFVREIHRSPVNFPHKGQWRGALMFYLICVWINAWVNNREAGDLRRHRGHYDVIVMQMLGYITLSMKCNPIRFFLIMPMKGVQAIISHFTVCRWRMSKAQTCQKHKHSHLQNFHSWPDS